MPTPYLIVSDASKAIDFYSSAFDAIELVRLETPDGKIAHAEIQVFGSTVMLADEYPEMGYKSPATLQGSPVSLYLQVPDADITQAKAVGAGAKEMMAVSDQFDGDRRGTVVDPFGHIWLLAAKKETISYAAMRERFTKLVGGASDA